METRKVSFDKLIVVFCIVIAVEWVTSLFPFGAWYPHLTRTAVARAVEILLILAYLHTMGGGLTVIGLNPMGMRNGLKTGIWWSICFGAIVAVIGAILFIARINPIVYFKMTLPDTTTGVLFFFLVGAIVSPVAEELFFRGMLFGYLRRWGLPTALVASTALFAALHGVHAVPITQIIGGIVFGFAYEKSNSLLAPMIIHTLANSAIFSLVALTTG
ncbi:MAG: CPBP family intramembrane metalloprotease [Desulfobacteraceae bacterium]|nr:CPBP family intramembrane metalloprotease [Desulfobacteraceae bacterium]